MGVGGAAAEDAEAEYIRKICERDIVTGLLMIFFCGYFDLISYGFALILSQLF